MFRPLVRQILAIAIVCAVGTPAMRAEARVSHQDVQADLSMKMMDLMLKLQEAPSEAQGHAYLREFLRLCRLMMATETDPDIKELSRPLLNMLAENFKEIGIDVNAPDTWPTAEELANAAAPTTSSPSGSGTATGSAGPSLGGGSSAATAVAAPVPGTAGGAAAGDANASGRVDPALGASQCIRVVYEDGGRRAGGKFGGNRADVVNDCAFPVAVAYCSKGGDFESFGAFWPLTQRYRNMFRVEVLSRWG